MALPFVEGSRYVAPTGEGYTVAGAPAGSQYFPTQGEAESYYNSQFPDPAAAPPGYTAPGQPNTINTGYELGLLGQKYALERLNRLDIPQFEWQKQFSGQQLGQQESQFARSLGLSQQQFDQLKAYQNALLQQQQGQLNLQGELGRGGLKNQELATRGQLALGGLGLASQEALGRQGLGLNAAQAAAQTALGRQGLGLNAAQAADAATLARANLVLQSGGPANAFQQQAMLYGLRPDGSLGLNGLLSGEGAAPSFQAPQAPLEAQTAEGIDRQIGGGLYGPNAAPQLMNRLATQNIGNPTEGTGLMNQLATSSINQPYSSPSSQAAMAMAGPNSEYSTPGSVLQQIPGLGQRFLDAATKASQSNYGVQTDPNAIIAAGQSLYQDPVYLKALQTGDTDTKNRMEVAKLAETSGLPPDRVQVLRGQLTDILNKTGAPATPELMGQLLQAHAGQLKVSRLTNLAQEILGFDPQTAQQFYNDWDRNFAANGGNLPNPADLERDIARRYGYGGAPTIGGGGVATNSGAGVQGPGSMNYSRQPQTAVDPRSGMTPVAASPQMQGMMGQLNGAGGADLGAQRGVVLPSANAGNGEQMILGPGSMNYMRQGAPSVGSGAVPGFGGAPAADGYRAPASVNQAQQFLSALPQTNQINARNFFHADPASQQFTLSALRFRGEDPNSALRTLQQALPKSAGATTGMVL